jgi:2-oxoglutarate ferredoxin oxidoreductase subunit beta
MHELSDIYNYLRWKKRFPTVWCAGCGIGTVMGSILRGMMDLKIHKDDVAFISGIGCTGRMPVYLDFNTMHTTHGRALAFATGVKMHRPKMKVVVVSGDGDALAIGGNHFIHAARRNIDITLILINNSIYGMTGGQVAPTTPVDAKAHTTPYGNYEPPFNPVELAVSAGATFVARSTTYAVVQTTNFIKKAINHNGFSLVEIISQCPTQYGRLNKLGNAKSMLLSQKENSISLIKSKKMSEDDLKDKIITGIFRERERPEYTKAYRDYVKNIQSQVEE